MREPLPLACLSVGGVRGRRGGGADRRRPRTAAWECGLSFPARTREPEHELVLGGVRPFDELLAEPARADERARVGRGGAHALRPLARRLWAGLLAREHGRTGERVTEPRRSTSAARCPTGVTVLEASAGTGKTYTIAALAARYVAEGDAARRSCCSSPSRAWRPASCASACASGSSRPSRRSTRALAGAPPDARRGRRGCSPTGRRDEVALRRDRLAARAGRLRRRDDRHHARLLPGGARRARRRRATSSATSTFVEDVGDLVERGRRRPLRAPLPPPASRRRSRRAEALADRPRRGRQPRRADRAGRRARAARRPRCGAGSPRRVREELERRKRRLGVMTYDDLLTRLDATLAGPSGAAAAERLRARYGVVLVDEFQDTDPVQWDIMRARVRRRAARRSC